MTPADIIRPGSIIGIAAPTKAALFQILAGKAAERLGLPEHVVLEALSRRESLGSTGVGKGVALPHASLPGLAEPFGLLARLKHPVDYEAIDGEPVDLVCLVLASGPRRAARVSTTCCWRGCDRRRAPVPDMTAQRRRHRLVRAGIEIAARALSDATPL